MSRPRRETGSDKPEPENKPVSIRFPPAIRAALKAEADDAGMKLSTYCRGLLERHLSGQTLELVESQIAELVLEQARQNDRINHLSVQIFDSLQILLSNLTDVTEDDLTKLRQRMLGR